MLLGKKKILILKLNKMFLLNKKNIFFASFLTLFLCKGDLFCKIIFKSYLTNI
jgi:hypothetical protein